MPVDRRLDSYVVTDDRDREVESLPAAPEVVWLSPSVPERVPNLLDGLVA